MLYRWTSVLRQGHAFPSSMSCISKLHVVANMCSLRLCSDSEKISVFSPEIDMPCRLPFSISVSSLELIQQ